MSRYERTKKAKISGTGRQYYRTTIYNEAPKKNDDMYFIAQEGDRLDNLAFRFYNDSALWWFIARVNNLKTMNVPAGTSLRIPAHTTDAEGF